MADSRNVDPRFAHLGRDLLITPFFQAAEWDLLDLITHPRGTVYRDEQVDLESAEGPACLQQALVLRLLTPRGCMSDLAHPDYGSRLHLLIGEIDGAVTRARAKAYVLEALAMERRLDKILAVDVLPAADGAGDRLLISANVLPKGTTDPISLGLEVAL